MQNIYLPFIAISLAVTSATTPAPTNHIRFSKVGDSITATPAFLSTFDTRNYYNLGDYEYLQEAVDSFKGSFSRQSLAAEVGWSALGVVAPNLANKDVCRKWETPLECEYRVWKPSVAIIMLGTNDAASGVSLQDFETNLNLIINISQERGVFVIFSTIPPSSKFDVTNYNNVIRQVAETRQVDLVDYWLVLNNTAPNSGLSPDGIHPSWGPMMSGDLTSDNGMTIRNHLVLEELYRVLETTNANPSGS